MNNISEETTQEKQETALQKDVRALVSESNLIQGASRLKREKALKAQALILDYDENEKGKKISLGMTDPTNQPNLQMVADELSTHWQNLEVVKLDADHYNNLFQVAYGKTANQNESELAADSKNWKDLVDFGNAADDEDETVQKHAEPIASLGEAKARTAKDFVQQIMRTALQIGASDLHFDMGPKTGMVRFRIDGILYNKFRTSFGHFDFSEVENKTLLSMCGALAASAKINYEDILKKPYDSSLYLHNKIQGKTRKTKVRFASVKREVETGDGRGVKVTLRLNQNMITDINALGIEPEVISIIEKGLKYIGGIGFIAGGTGSGKTNILASMHTQLREGNTRQVMEYGDTIEHMFDGMVQTETNDDCTEADVIKSYLRHDPDAIIASEVRDEEVTKKLVELATSGKLVLSTVHVNSMPGIFIRLEKLGIDRYSQSETLRFVIFTTLVRKLCEQCKVKGFQLRGCETECYEYTASEAGCVHCRFIGYRGRTAITEALCVTSSVAEWIAEGVSGAEICQRAEEAGWLFPLKEAIRRKFVKGITSRDEILRVIDMEKRFSQSSKPDQKAEFVWRNQPSKNDTERSAKSAPKPPENYPPDDDDKNIIDLYETDENSYSIDEVEVDWQFDDIDDEEADEAVSVLGDVIEAEIDSEADEIFGQTEAASVGKKEINLNGNGKR